MRKVVQQTERIVYQGEDDIALAIQIAKGQLVSNGVSNADVSTMVDGESRIDFTTQKEFIKMNGKLYERVIVDSKIKLQEIK
jgi:hypothetical protein